jgi:hypothetical protein
MTDESMPTTSEFAHPPADTTPETPDARDRRIAYERALLDHAREEIRAGRIVPDEALDEWLDAFATGDDPLPIPGDPSPGKRKSGPISR